MRANAPPGRQGIAALLRAGVVQFVLLWAASRVSVSLHELVGHALPGALLGLRVEGVTVTWFGGGRVDFGGSVDGAAALVVGMGGIFVNGVLWAVALGLWSRVAGSSTLRSPAAGGAGVPLLGAGSSREGGGREAAAPPWWPSALAVFAAVNAVGATHYAALGAFYGFGDPAPWPVLWPPSLVLLVLLVPWTLRVWVRTVSPPGHGPRALILAAIALVLYGGGFAAERALSRGETRFRALEAESVAIDRAVAEEQRRREDSWRRAHPGEEPPPEAIRVATDDVPRPFPLTATVISFDVAALLVVALRRPRPR